MFGVIAVMVGDMKTPKTGGEARGKYLTIGGFFSYYPEARNAVRQRCLDTYRRARWMRGEENRNQRKVKRRIVS